MKTILALAAIAAALASSSVASANDRDSGRWDWQSRPTFGPNKSNLSSLVRVWVKGGEARMANCDCSMMKADSADCMMDMSGKRRTSAAG